MRNDYAKFEHPIYHDGEVYIHTTERLTDRETSHLLHPIWKLIWKIGFNTNNWNIKNVNLKWN